MTMAKDGTVTSLETGPDLQHPTRRTIPALITVDPGRRAEVLRVALEKYGIAANVHDGYGLALVSVWVGLVVWCDGDRFWWRTGWDARRRRFVYARHPATDPDRAARRVTFRYRELQETHPLSELIAESMS
ncbi:hypothetical protein [Streptosporangium sp. NBC_01756]|uniref:hypothetical protein n=1 Tax=Streptosporangium sp. NBC_01756 TaxID=2975950 RepID=UPI002DDB49B9|nr:hypothetical protein [Streptosporangium sp. NBC_01756]WSC87480.1 hypothetical protein OIE48_04510 [Streptosporangium sp. NBC_01756]